MSIFLCSKLCSSAILKFEKKKCCILFFFIKNALFEYFWARILKKLLSYLKSVPSNLSICKFSRKKQKCLNLGPKMSYLGIFDQKCLIWVFLGKNFKTAIFIFEISSLIFVSLQNFTKKEKMPKFGTKNVLFGYFWPKMPYLGIFGLHFQNCYYHIWNQHPQISQNWVFNSYSKFFLKVRVRFIKYAVKRFIKAQETSGL